MSLRLAQVWPPQLIWTARRHPSSVSPSRDLTDPHIEQGWIRSLPPPASLLALARIPQQGMVATLPRRCYWPAVRNDPSPSQLVWGKSGVRHARAARLPHSPPNHELLPTELLIGRTCPPYLLPDSPLRSDLILHWNLGLILRSSIPSLFFRTSKWFSRLRCEKLMLLREDTELRHSPHARPRFSDSDSGLICDLSVTGRTTIAHHSSGAARGRGIRRDGLEITCRSLFRRRRFQGAMRPLQPQLQHASFAAPSKPVSLLSEASSGFL